MSAFYSYTYQNLQDLFKSQGLKPQEARLLYNWHYKKKKITPCNLFGLSKNTQEFTKTLDFHLPKIEETLLSSDKTVKFRMSLNDGSSVETVLIPFNKKYSICLSSQVGCAMRCAFCFTGTQGLTRHLKTEEIIGQLMAAQFWLNENRPTDNRISNVVFMGQGEPLHNFDSVRDAVLIMISQFGLSMADHKITVSTSGYLPGLERWKNEMPTVNIALSLHSLNDEKRSQIIPLNKKYPVNDIIPLVESFPEGKKRFVTYEYLLIADFNDSVAEAEELAGKMKNTKAFINLIPFNPFPGTQFKRPSDQRIQAFFDVIQGQGVPVTMRTTKGDEILAACGQLNTRKTIS